MKLPIFGVREQNGSEDIAFFVDGVALTQAEFISRAQQLSALLPLKTGYVVNLSTCRYRFTLGFAAALLRGLVNLLPANRQPRTVTSVVDRYPDCLVLHDEPLEPDILLQLERRGIEILDLQPLSLRSDVSSSQTNVIPPEQLAAIVFTSGSSGEPSAIPKPWKTLVHTTALLRDRFIGSGCASIVATVPPQHMYGLETTVLMSLLGGCSVSATHPFFPADIAQALAEVPAPRILVTTPIHMKTLLQSGVELPPMDTIISATAPLLPATALEAEKRWACEVKEIYGCSEAGSLASRRTSVYSVWTMLDGVTLKSVEGSINVRAPHLSEAVVLPDTLEIIAPDVFRLLGRSEDMLNIAGKRASLAELTTQLQNLDGVADGVFFVRADGRRDVQRLAALVVTDRPEGEILIDLAKRIDPAFMPRPLKKVRVIPRNVVGKLPREALLQALCATETDTEVG